MSRAYEYNKKELVKFVSYVKPSGETLLSFAVEKAFDLLMPFRDDNSSSKTVLF